jgi:tripartite-type tricarboxylate transporter receptor subunit TctC
MRLPTALLALFLGLPLFSALAQDWPARPIRLVVPTTAGGTADQVGRLVAEQLGTALKQPVVVDNKPGAGTNIGNEHVARAPGDGYTLLIGAATLAINPNVYPGLAYSPEKDLVPITRMVRVANVVVVRGDSPITSLGELVQRAKAAPGSVAYGSPGVGTSVHLGTELFKVRARVDMLHVPYKSSAQSTLALLSGEVQVAFENMPVVLSQIRAGKLRALAVTSRRRSESLPEVPTVTEQTGIDYDISTWFGVLAPSGTPAAIVERVDAELQRSLARSEVRRSIEAMGAELAGDGPREFRQLLRDETQRWAEVARSARVTVP